MTLFKIGAITNTRYEHNSYPFPPFIDGDKTDLNVGSALAFTSFISFEEFYNSIVTDPAAVYLNFSRSFSFTYLSCLFLAR